MRFLSLCPGNGTPKQTTNTSSPKLSLIQCVTYLRPLRKLPNKRPCALTHTMRQLPVTPTPALDPDCISGSTGLQPDDFLRATVRARPPRLDIGRGNLLHSGSCRSRLPLRIQRKHLFPSPPPPHTFPPSPTNAYLCPSYVGRWLRQVQPFIVAQQLMG